MDLNVEVVEAKLYAGVVADEIVASLNDSISDHGSCSLCLAGGITPSVIYRTLAKPPRVKDVDWSKVAVFWGDERWVPLDDMQSNFKMANETLLSQISGARPTVHPVNTSLASAEDGARGYASTIRSALGVKEGETPQLDVVLLGVGDDGHTASIFPGSMLLTETEQDPVCAAVEHPDGESKRVTLTPKTIFSAKRLIFIVTGAAKAPIVRRILSSEDLSLPASLYRRAAGKVTWFVDSAAAQGLKV